MTSVTWVHHLCQGLRQSQIKTFLVIWTAFIECKSAILNELAEEMTRQQGTGIVHTLKRIQRFLGNERVERKTVYQNITRFVWRRIRHWKNVPIAIDWTFCEKREKWRSLAASIVIQGRGIPILVWSFPKGSLGKYKSQNAIEEAFLIELSQMVASNPRKKQTVVILADRGFARPCLFKHIQELGWHYVIRLKHNVFIKDKDEKVLLGDIALKKGETQEYRQVRYRNDGIITVPRVIAKRPSVEKEFDPWFLASSLTRSAEAILRLYSLRFTIEEDFRTMKSTLNWKECRIRKLEHYRQFVLFMVVTLVLSLLVGMAAEQKPSLARHLVRKRKGKADTCVTVVGIRLIRYSWESLNYIRKIDKLKYPM